MELGTLGVMYKPCRILAAAVHAGAARLIRMLDAHPSPYVVEAVWHAASILSARGLKPYVQRSRLNCAGCLESRCGCVSHSGLCDRGPS